MAHLHKPWGTKQYSNAAERNMHMTWLHKPVKNRLAPLSRWRFDLRAHLSNLEDIADVEGLHKKALHCSHP